MNTRGQAFSTFQLLISAVVALAILVILLNILNIIQFPFDQKVSKEASNMIAGQVTNPSQLQTSGRIIVRTGDTLNAKAIASSSNAITEDQLCISKGDHENSADVIFTDSEQTILQYTGTQLGVKLSVICDTGTELAEDLQRNGIQDDWMQGPGCEAVQNSNQTACVVALRYA